MARALGIDLGSKRIGVAVSDGGGKVATPLTVLQRSSDANDASAIAEMAAAEEATVVVVGFPLNMDGSKGDAALVAEAFARQLEGRGFGVELLDERLTTVEAEKRLIGRGMKGRKRKEVVDKVAAAVILQAYLDMPKRRKRSR